MATILLSAAGAAIGGSVGGTLAGLSSVAIGRAVGATLGKAIDQKLLGAGAQAVETGKVDRFRLTGSGEGDAVSQLFGRMRIGGQVIWASDFQEVAATSGGGKGAPSGPKTTTYSYSVSLAIALCHGEITRVGRIWADGEEIAPKDINLTVYTGAMDQQPDPAMEAVEGAGQVPAYRGTAYVVMENLALEPFGNRVPQFTFEVVRPEPHDEPDADYGLTRGVQGVAMIPGTGEYALATTPVHYVEGQTSRWSANVNTPAGITDFSQSLEILGDELPNCKATSLVVSWFGDDLRCGSCTVRPKVEQPGIEGENMPWSVSGLDRAGAQVIVQDEGRPLYGGTPTDQSVVEAIRAMNDAGQAVMFYPFILMDQGQGNALPDPYSDAQTQPHLPWRGRITLSQAPGRPGSPSGTAAAESEVLSFFGSVEATDFSIVDGEVIYSGPDEWSLSRFILHYAALCQAAGGVDAFCIGSEMRGLTQIMGPDSRFVAVEQFRALAAQVRALVGPQTKISYAADWTEYWGFQPLDGSGSRYFHLDPLWADDNIDFIGIDNYMPLSDWRDGDKHADAEHGSIYDEAYLRSNIEGGEGFDWYYPDAEARDMQRRSEITDGAHGEPWIYRYKDIRNWWSNPHHERIDGVRQNAATDWIPQSKPIWFTELGCAAVDKGTNQPNKFLDQKSSESSLPHFSNGKRDDLIQMQYLRAMYSHWDNPAHNPVSVEYDAPMIDMSRAFVWAWDVRPYPFFPNNLDLWSDGKNYLRGHWINGRTSTRSLASVVGEICRKAGLTHFDTGGLYGVVRGYTLDDVSDARSALQPLMLRYAFDAIERDGVLRFRMRDGAGVTSLDPSRLVATDELNGTVEQIREAEAELSGRTRFRFVQADADFDVLAEEAVLNDDATHAVSGSEVPIALTRAEGRQVAERWLVEARVARDTARLALPPSALSVGAGDVISVPQDQGEGEALYRVDRVEQEAFQLVEAVRIEPQVYTPLDIEEDLARVSGFVPPVPVVPLFLDLPLIRGDEVAHAPYIAASAQPWPGSIAVYQSATDSNYQLNTVLPTRAIIGTTQNALHAAPAGIFDRGAALEVKLMAGSLSAVDEEALLSGGNLAAIGDGSAGTWELFQFEQAELLSAGTYLLRKRLRGQLGTDGVMPTAWPPGSWVVLMNGVPNQIEISRNLRRVAQHYRIGPARRAVDDPSYRYLTEAFEGNGLRPYAPAHLRFGANGSDLQVTWVRRTRQDGDSWDAAEVPLAEETERYLVQVRQGDVVVRETEVSEPVWVYTAAERASDGIIAPYTVQVAQVSAVYGAGPFRAATVGG